MSPNKLNSTTQLLQKAIRTKEEKKCDKESIKKTKKKRLDKEIKIRNNLNGYCFCCCCCDCYYFYRYICFDQGA